ncbi:T9SS type A sorting domain-containing protein [Algibacter amylolyticus]|uniref:T9SS type A sorting domain-containing protein n=1 Tax=Algibacter amylolyticus TaxID=1608400 RepID=A0A5M7AWJ2_9FLAO|nr:T9SS type A sorting domain-containing protein [Algibacter amylolyticus]KAA5821856.1 T9SS type A sorting domain-containing protein [Algibacter amylolyticus]MBB5269346.1 hypothetical protein [Algibacter amylolyticus]TSJ73140.1 T9SS type A sorting domain-containing protein [Algibacter amylolyticus]
MKTKLHLLFFAVLFSLGIQAQTISVTSTLPSTIETGDALDFITDYNTGGVTPYSLIVRLYESDGTTRYGSDQGVVNLVNVSGTETVSINAPLVAGDYVAKVFLEDPSDYSKTFAPDIPLTVTPKVVSVKDSYSFNTDGDSEGWLIGTTGGANPTANVTSGAIVINRGSGAWGTTYIEQSEYKLDPTVHSYVHITYKNLSKPNENNEIGLDWITSGGARSTEVNLPIETSDWSTPMADFKTVSYNLGDNTEWIHSGMSVVADATNFRLYIREAGGSTKSGDLEIDSIIFNDVPPSTLTNNKLKTNLKSVSVYPNPFKDSFSYQFDSNTSQSVNVELFTITGQKIKDIKNATISNNRGTVNTENLSKGMYLVRISSGDIQETKRLIKN